MKLYKQKKGKTWSMGFVFEGQRIEQSTGHTNLRKAEAFAEALRTKLRNEGVGILKKSRSRVSEERWRIFSNGRGCGKRRVLLPDMKLRQRPYLSISVESLTSTVSVNLKSKNSLRRGSPSMELREG